MTIFQYRPYVTILGNGKKTQGRKEDHAEVRPPDLRTARRVLRRQRRDEDHRRNRAFRFVGPEAPESAGYAEQGGEVDRLRCYLPNTCQKEAV